MEDVRQRLGEMGLSGVTMEQLSEVEWKLGEIKVGGGGNNPVVLSRSRASLVTCGRLFYRCVYLYYNTSTEYGSIHHAYCRMTALAAAAAAPKRQQS